MTRSYLSLQPFQFLRHQIEGIEHVRAIKHVNQMQKEEDKAKSKRYVLRRLLKVATEVAERTDSERLFQREGAHELKALAPVMVLTLGMD